MNEIQAIPSSGIPSSTIPSSEAKYLHDKLETIESFLSFCRGGAAPAWPLEVFLEVSNLCDLKCAMCTYFSAISPVRLLAMKQSARGFFDLDAAGGGIEQVLRHALLIHCYGFGEPTIHPQFREFLAYALEFEAMVDFFTNGMHLTDDLAAFLVDHRVFRISVSFSGSTKEEYEAVYLGGQFEEVLRGIKKVSDYKKAVGAKYPIIAVNSIAFHHHVANLERFVDLMADHGADRIDLKQLIPYQDIPELYAHASILRPWVEGEILARAERRAAVRGIELHAADYATNAVRNEEEYQARLEQWQAALRSTGRETFPEVGIDDFRVLAKSTVYARPHDDVRVSAPSHPLSGNALRVLHDIGSVPTAKDGRAFYCMEPFKTLYIRRNGEVKPCCFGHDDAAFLGNVNETPAADVWRGPHFDTVRKAIVNGEYPRKLCGTCLRNGMGPASHEASYHIQRYDGWWRDRFGRPPVGDSGLSPWVELFAEKFTGDSVVDELFRQGSPLLEVNDGEKLLEAVLHCAGLFPSLHRGLTSLVEGYLDRVSEERVEGWVWSPLFPPIRLPITVWVGDVAVAEGVARNFRGDLLAAGKGDGRYGFSVPLGVVKAAETKANGSSKIRVTLGKTNCVLDDTPLGVS